MKKLYTFGAIAALLLAPATSAFSQQATAKKVIKDQKMLIPRDVVRSSIDVDYDMATNREVVFTNGFDDIDEWTIETDLQGTWEIVTEMAPNLAFNFGEMGSPTAGDGFAQFNALDHLFATDDGVDHELQNSTITYNGIIPCGDMTDVIITVFQKYAAFNVDETFIEVSTDLGDNWTSFQVNEDEEVNGPTLNGEVSVNVTQVAAGEDIMIRFRWHSDYLEDNPEATQESINNFGGGYLWIIDDVQVSSPPENDLVVNDTYYKNFWTIQEQDEFEIVDQLDNIEYHTQPFHSLHDFDFSAVVTNAGSEDQTGVILYVSFFDTEGNEALNSPYTSTPISIAAGASDTLRVSGISPSSWDGTQEGTYTMEFLVDQDQDDELPGNNIGVPLTTTINIADGMIQHGSTNTNDVGVSDNAIYGSCFTFADYDEDRVITHIEFALDEESNEGEIIYLNLRTGSVMEEESEDNIMELHYPANTLAYIIDADDLTTGPTPNFIRYELPFPLLIEAGKVYQPEISAPPVGVPYCVVSATSVRADFGSSLYDGDDPSTVGQGWYYIAGFAYNIRLLTAIGNSVNDVSVENGMKLVQNYPNPFTSETRIQFSIEESSNTRLEVFDISGKLVFEDNLGLITAGSANTYIMHRNGLAPGAYSYSIVTGTERISRKMIIE